MPKIFEIGKQYIFDHSDICFTFEVIAIDKSKHNQHHYHCIVTKFLKGSTLYYRERYKVGTIFLLNTSHAREITKCPEYLK